MLYVIIVGSTPSQFPFRDDFAGSGAITTLDTGQSWINQSTWQKSNNAATAVTDGHKLEVNVGPTHTVQARLQGHNTYNASFPTILVRSVPGSDTHYRVQQIGSAGAIQIVRRIHGQTAVTVWTSADGVLASGAIDTTLRVSASDNGSRALIHVWRGSTLLTPAAGVIDTAGSRPTGTHVGMRYAFTGTGNGYQWAEFRAKDTADAPA